MAVKSGLKITLMGKELLLHSHCHCLADALSIRDGYYLRLTILRFNYQLSNIIHLILTKKVNITFP